MDPSQEVFKAIKESGIDFIVSIPCANLQKLIPMVDSDPDIIHVAATREEEGIGICAGAYMGGKKPAIMMQNSGMGNSINALASLNRLYNIPLLIIISHRGVEGEPICAQVPMGEKTPHLLEVLDIPAYKPHLVQAKKTIEKATEKAFEEGKQAAILLSIGFWRES
ncbi:sulfopyruvate decarboxylase subunit alpha [Methanohalophilus sp.]